MKMEMEERTPMVEEVKQTRLWLFVMNVEQKPMASFVLVVALL